MQIVGLISDDYLTTEEDIDQTANKIKCSIGDLKQMSHTLPKCYNLAWVVVVKHCKVNFRP